MQNNISKERNLKKQITEYFLSNPHNSYNQAAKEIKCSKSMLSYYKDPIEARRQILARSGKVEFPYIWRFCFEKSKPYSDKKETFTSLNKKGRTFIYACSKPKNGETYMSKNKNYCIKM